MSLEFLLRNSFWFVDNLTHIEYFHEDTGRTRPAHSKGFIDADYSFPFWP